MTTTVRAGGLVPTARGVFDVVDEEKKECFLFMLYALTAMNDLARVLLEGDSKRFNYSTLFFFRQERFTSKRNLLWALL